MTTRPVALVDTESSGVFDKASRETGLQLLGVPLVVLWERELGVGNSDPQFDCGPKDVDTMVVNGPVDFRPSQGAADASGAAAAHRGQPQKPQCREAQGGRFRYRRYLALHRADFIRRSTPTRSNGKGLEPGPPATVTVNELITSVGPTATNAPVPMQKPLA